LIDRGNLALAERFADAQTLAQSMIGGGTQVVFIAGQTDGWLFWSGSGNAGQIDQMVTMSGGNSLSFMGAGDVV
jgi:hypothetical protein